MLKGEWLKMEQNAETLMALHTHTHTHKLDGINK